jgi:hypothetical protein
MNNRMTIGKKRDSKEQIMTVQETKNYEVGPLRPHEKNEGFI